MQQKPNESTESTSQIKTKNPCLKDINIHANIPVFSHYTYDKINIIYTK